MTQHFIIKGLFTAVPFTRDSISSYQEEEEKKHTAKEKEKIIRHTKRGQTQFEEKEVSEPDITEILELPDWEFKTAVIDMLRALMDKVDNI